MDLAAFWGAVLVFLAGSQAACGVHETIERGWRKGVLYLALALGEVALGLFLLWPPA